MNKLLKTGKGKLALVLVIAAILVLLSPLSETSKTTFVQVLPSAIICFALAGILFYFSAKQVNEPAEKTWSMWDNCRDSEPQRIRMSRAVDGKLTGLSVTPETKSALFVGGKGEKYKTTLKSCTCPDFKERNVPCKHMYRLAAELKMPNLPETLEINNY